MTFDELVAVLEEMELGEEIKFQTSSFTFGLLLEELQDQEVFIFGGYGTHQSIWQVEIKSIEEIAEGIEQHISGYHSEIEGKEWLTLDEIKIV